MGGDKRTGQRRIKEEVSLRGFDEEGRNMDYSGVSFQQKRGTFTVTSNTGGTWQGRKTMHGISYASNG